MSCWRYIASLPMRISSGDLAASLRRPVGDRGVELVVGHDPVDDPDPLRLVRADLLAQQQQLVGLLAPDVAVDQRHDHEREDADVDLRRPEAGALLGDDQVAREREAERAREHVPVGGAQRRLAELADQLEQPRERVGREVLVRRAARRTRTPFRSPPAEKTFSCVEVSTTQRTASSSRAPRERGQQVVEQLVRERVARLGPVEGDRGDADPATSYRTVVRAHRAAAA